MNNTTSLTDFLNAVKRRDPNQPEFLQAVQEVMTSVWPFLEKNPRYREQALLERLVEPDRVIQFRVTWLDDKGQIRINRAFRVQHSMAIGPYKGGMRFHPSVNLSILKFLGFEQSFKNALTTLPMGGGKGGSDFDPKGKSDGEVMHFCQALMQELYRYIGPDTDVPAGDIGVGAREIGYMAGMMKKLTANAGCTFTGKGLTYGGSLIRPEATGYGLVYFTHEMLDRAHGGLKGRRVSISGSGNVAQYAADKALEMGAQIITLSDSGGTAVFEQGLTRAQLQDVIEFKEVQRGRMADFCAKHKIRFEAGRKPWHVPVDIALPCATENELNAEDARALVANGVRCVAEGANMPTTLDAVDVFQSAGVLYAPGKASNAGGVATSGLEMSQNAIRLSWTAQEVDQRLHDIMKNIHENCVRHGSRADGTVDYLAGANIAGFVKLADAMMAQGVL